MSSSKQAAPAQAAGGPAPTGRPGTDDTADLPPEAAPASLLPFPDGSESPPAIVDEPTHRALPTPAEDVIVVSATTRERLRHEQARLASDRGRPVSMNELILHLLDGEDRSRSRYIPVIAVTPEAEPRALKTVAGDVPVEPDDLSGLAPACPPIDLERELARIQAELAQRPAPTRSRPAMVDRYLQARSGGVCEGLCRRPGTGVHHWVSWIVSRAHDPANLSVMCGDCMALADGGLLVRDADGKISVVVAPQAPRNATESRVRIAQERYEEEKQQAIRRARHRRLRG